MNKKELILTLIILGLIALIVIFFSLYISNINVATNSSDISATGLCPPSCFPVVPLVNRTCDTSWNATELLGKTKCNMTNSSLHKLSENRLLLSCYKDGTHFIDIREVLNGKPTIKGIHLTKEMWKRMLTYL